MRIDFHSHVLPAVDDGAKTVEQAIDALRAFAAHGVTTVVTTPHFDISLTRNASACAARLGEFDRAFQVLVDATRGMPGLPVLKRGTEVMLDEPDADVDDPRIRLDGGPFVLCEFPAFRLPVNAEWGIQNLIQRGWWPIIGHPERYRNLDGDLAMLGRLRKAGALFQLNAGSLTGEYGQPVTEVAWRLLARGWIDYCSSDYHARGTLSTAHAASALADRGGEELAYHLTVNNPARLLRGELPEPTRPFKPTWNLRSWWRRRR